jgi:hypothetical protein
LRLRIQLWRGLVLAHSRACEACCHLGIRQINGELR